MQMMAILRDTSEDNIVQALLSSPVYNWPQDERELLILFNHILDLRIAAACCQEIPHSCRTSGKPGS